MDQTILLTVDYHDQNCRFTDGSVGFVRESIPLPTLAAVCTAKGGEVVAGIDY